MKFLAVSLIVGLILIESINSAYTSILVRRLYKRLNDESNWAGYSKIILWHEANVERFEAVDQERVKSIAFHRQLSVVFLVVFFAVCASILLFNVFK